MADGGQEMVPAEQVGDAPLAAVGDRLGPRQCGCARPTQGPRASVATWCRNAEQARRDRAVREEIVAQLRQQLGRGEKQLVGNRGYRRYLRKVLQPAPALAGEPPEAPREGSPEALPVLTSGLFERLVPELFWQQDGPDSRIDPLLPDGRVPTSGGFGRYRKELWSSGLLTCCHSILISNHFDGNLI